MTTYNDLITAYKDIDPDIDTSPASIDGQVITYNSMLIDELKDQIEELSKSNNLNDAQGQQLRGKK